MTESSLAAAQRRGRGAAAGPGHGGHGRRAGPRRACSPSAATSRATRALSDLLGWEHVRGPPPGDAPPSRSPRGPGWTARVLPARLPATAQVFARGRTSLRHVEVIARLLVSWPGRPKSPEKWAGAEAQLGAGQGRRVHPARAARVGQGAGQYAFDQDGEEPDDRPPAQTNELLPDPAPGTAAGSSRAGSTTPRCSMRIAAVIDAHATPLTSRRRPRQRGAAGRGAGRCVRLRARSR